jgi:TatD DNase family protein
MMAFVCIAQHCDDDTLPLLRRLAAHPRCVAVGECGLDFNRNFSPPDAQERWFQAQVALAQELCMPLFLHCRDAGPRFLDLLRWAPAPRARRLPPVCTLRFRPRLQRSLFPPFWPPCRAAHPAGGASGVLHCFTGSSEELQAALALGLHVGVTGWVCDERPERGGGALGDLLPLIPDDRLLLETDAPYLTPRTIA